MRPVREDVRMVASKRFNPKTLSKFLIKLADGTAIVDRSAIVQNADDKRLLIVIMNADYRWNYINYDESAIYFEVDGGNVNGGIYDLTSGEKITRRVVAAEKNGGLCRCYRYGKDVFAQICQSIIGV